MNYNVIYCERTGERYNDLWNFDFYTVRGDRKSLIFAGPLLRNYAKILKEEKQGNKIYFTVLNLEILEYIAIKERNTLNFLDIYLDFVVNTFTQMYGPQWHQPRSLQQQYTT